MARINFLKTLEEEPKGNFYIHSLKTPSVNEKTLMLEARRFNLGVNRKNGTLIKDGDEFTYLEGSQVVTLYSASGALRMYDSTRWQMDDGKANMKISDEEALEIAAKFIKETGIIDMSGSKLYKVTRLFVGNMDRESKKSEERVIDVGVVFQRHINGIPVEGPGGKTVVYIDQNREVSGCDRILREIDNELKKTPVEKILKPKDAREDLIKYWDREGIEQVEVSETRFGYFEFGPNDSQKFLQPAYIMPLKIISKNERFVKKSVHVTAAVPRPPEKLMPGLKKETKESPRRG